MSKIEFINENTIERVESISENIRSERSKLLSFYCYGCKCVHSGFEIKDIVFIGEEMYMCKKSFEEIMRNR